MREDIIKRVESERLIVILRGIADEKLIPLAEAMYEGGIRLLEITYSADGSVSDKKTANSIRRLCEHFGERMYIGAGTVLTERQVELTQEAGGGFIISPDTSYEVIKRTRELGLVSMPGALTPTEIQAAHKYGADFVKLFPVVSLGPDYVKAVRAPLSHVRLLAVGGVDEANMADYLKAGVSGFGIGSSIVDKPALERSDYAAITERARRYVEVIKR